MLALVLLACAHEVAITPSQGGCTDFSYEDPAPSEVVWEPQADGVTITRTNILLDEAGLTFAPELAIDGKQMDVRERWTDPASDDQFCYTASLFVEGFAGELEVRWYLEDETVPFQTILIEQ